VSRAAKRSFLSQPAMSRALDRLRDAFGDPLLVRSGRVYERTPRGERVLREIEPIMRRLQAIVRDEEFTPAQSQERFRVAMSDHGSTILLSALLQRLRKEAPQSERIPFFIPAVFAITETDLVLTVPRTLATITARLAGLRKVEPPREIRPFP
jgi:DNA-binding transcriptional LysR family regulator